MNIYRFDFAARCPTNDACVQYQCEIRSSRMILADDLSAWAAAQVKGFHEEFADSLSSRFGGQQKIVAVHHGIEIETIRP